MIQSIYIFLGVLATGVSAIAVSNRLPVDVKVAAATAAFVLWTLWGFSSYNVETITNTGTVIESQYTSLVLVGLSFAAVMLTYAIWTIMGMLGMDPKRLLRVRV